MSADHQDAISRLRNWSLPGGPAYASHQQFYADIRALLDLVTWRPISEAPLKDGERLMLYIVHPGDSYTRMCGEPDGWTAINVGYWNAARQEWEHETAGSPTHFLPLPTAPEASHG